MSGAVVRLTKLALDSLSQERALPTDPASGSVTGTFFTQVLFERETILTNVTSASLAVKLSNEMIISITYVFTSGFTRLPGFPPAALFFPPPPGLCRSGGGGGGGSSSGGPGGGGRLSGLRDAARLPPA